MSVVNEDQIMKNRILFDTRKLKQCYRKFLQYAATSNRTPAEIQLGRDLFLAELAALEVSLLKHQLVHEMNAREVQKYEIEKSRIEDEINMAQVDISSLRKELEQAQIHRRNKIEYDNLAKLINKQPSRAVSHDKSLILNSEIQALLQENAKLLETQSLREKQLITIVTTIHEVQDSIAERKREAEMAAAAETDALPATPPVISMEEEEEGVVPEDGEKADAMDLS